MITVYGRDNCSWCEKTVELLETTKMPYRYHKLGIDLTLNEFKEMFPDAKTVPVIIVNGLRVGGYTDLVGYIEETSGGYGDGY